MTPSWHEKLRGGFKRTSDRLLGNLAGLGTGPLDRETLDEIEEALIASDLGPETASRIRTRLSTGTFERDMEELGIRLVVAEEIEKVLDTVAKPLEISGFPRPHVILVIGVNGSGKTTTIAKLAHLLKEQDYGVMLAAGDTFRAAAIGQLATWAERAGVPIISGKEGGDAAGIVYEAVKQATATGIDVLIVDTAGRLQNKRELMDELSKIRRVLGRLNVESPHDVLLVLDATTGQNALSQIAVFKKDAGVTGLVATKLDGTARGGVLVAAAEKYGLPIHAIGVGEGMGDLRPFDANEVARIIAGVEGGAAMNPTPIAPLPDKKAPLGAGQRLAIDIGPIAIFFLVNFLTPGLDIVKLLAGTAAFMLASVAAMIYSLLRAGRISPMLWVTGTLVLVFGGLTLYFHNKDFIQIKPTVIYAMLSAILIFGLWTGRPLLSLFLDAAYPGLNETGWRKLTINWAAFFAFLAVLNEIVRHEFSYAFWLGFKLWGVIPLTLLFAFANVPMLMKHGFHLSEDPPVPPVE